MHNASITEWISSDETEPWTSYISAVIEARVHSGVAIHYCPNCCLGFSYPLDVMASALTPNLWVYPHSPQGIVNWNPCTETRQFPCTSLLSWHFYTSACLCKFIIRIINRHLQSSCRNICLSLVKFVRRQTYSRGRTMRRSECWREWIVFLRLTQESRSGARRRVINHPPNLVLCALLFFFPQQDPW